MLCGTLVRSGGYGYYPDFQMVAPFSLRKIPHLRDAKAAVVRYSDMAETNPPQ